MADEVRLIDANALHSEVYGDGDLSKKETRAAVLLMIEKSPTIEVEPVNGGWINVKDRLPENDGKYMVWYKGECEKCEFDTDSQTFGYTYDDYDEMYSHLVCWDDGINKDVTHWQPLPKLPKGE